MNRDTQEMEEALDNFLELVARLIARAHLRQAAEAEREAEGVDESAVTDREESPE